MAGRLFADGLGNGVGNVALNDDAIAGDGSGGGAMPERRDGGASVGIGTVLRVAEFKDGGHSVVPFPI